MVKPPSPQTEMQGRSGAASCAPSTLHTPKPIDEKPQLFSMLCVRRGFQNCMNQLWCTPESSVRMAFSGSTCCNASTTYSGRNGVVTSAKCGRTNFSHSAHHPATCARHSA